MFDHLTVVLFIWRPIFLSLIHHPSSSCLMKPNSKLYLHLITKLFFVVVEKRLKLCQHVLLHSVFSVSNVVSFFIQGLIESVNIPYDTLILITFVEVN